MTDHQKSECPAATGHIAEQQSTDSSIVARPDAACNAVKRLANLTAQFALRGFEVYEVKDGFLVTRWNLSKHVATLDDLERFARVVGAA
jgi:hypothetical protein